MQKYEKRETEREREKKNACHDCLEINSSPLSAFSGRIPGQAMQEMFQRMQDRKRNVAKLWASKSFERLKGHL